jgi:ribosomal protein L14E/L6E/L27E
MQSQLYISETFAEQAAVVVYETIEENVSSIQEPKVREEQEQETVEEKTIEETGMSIQEPRVQVVRRLVNNTLHDKTIRWSRSVQRMWLDKHVTNLLLHRL